MSGATLQPEAVASVPNPCPAAPTPCEAHQTRNIASVNVGGNIASATALTSEAHAFRDPAVSTSPEKNADLQSVMNAASGVTLPTEWNTRGYGSATGFSALGGTIRADVVEAETVSGTRDVGGTITPVSASGARVVNLRLSGALGDPVTGNDILLAVIPNQPNQTVFNAGGLRIVFWETNWNRNTGTTTDGQPVRVTTLRITDTITGANIAVAQANSFAPYTAPPPPPPPSNDPPVANDDSASTVQNTGVDIDVTNNDTDPDNNLDDTTVSVTTDPTNGDVTCDDNVCTYTPDPGFVGSDSFVYEVCDTQGECDSATVTITVSAPAAPNNPPVAQDDSASTDQDVAIDINVPVNDSDPDGDPLTVTAGTTASTQGGEVVCDADSCTYTPPAGFTGIDTFTYEICDPDGDCDTATVTVAVTDPDPAAPNNPPLAIDDSVSTGEGVAVPVINVMSNDSDPDGDPITITPSAGLSAEGGTVSCTVASCSYIPPAGFSGSDSFTYEICDSNLACATATVTVTVTPAPAPPAPNNPPVAQDDTATTDEDTAISIDVVNNPTGQDSDPDGNLVASTVSVTVQPANGSVTCSAGVCTYTPDPGFVGTDTFTYRICDSDSACVTADVTVTVNAGPPPPPPANDPPVANNDSTTSNGGPVTVSVINNDSDPESDLDPSSVTVTQPPTNGAVICTGGSCTYTPEAGFTGTDSFEYQVCDNQNFCDSAVVTITVTGPGPVAGAANQPPIAEDDTVTGQPGEPIEIVVVDNDSDPDGNLNPGSVTVVDPPEHGAVICSQGVCTYTPEAGYTGPDSFTYRVCDSLGACTVATVTIDVPAAPLPTPSPTVSPDEPDGSIGEGGGSGNGNGNGGGGGGAGGPDRPDRDGQPSRPGDDDDAGIDPVPLTGLNPILGAPNNPAMPMTGGEPGFYLALALNLVLAGGLLLFLDTRSRRAAPVTVPELLGGAIDHGEPENELSTPELAALPVEQARTDEPSTKPAAKKATPAKKPVAKKPATTRKPAVKKATTKASTAKKTTAAKTSSKKSTVTKPAAKKASTTKKTTARASSTKKSTVARKATPSKARKA